MIWCSHKLKYLVTEREQTVQKINKDFNKITYHFLCTNCNKQVKINHRQTILSIEKFLDLDKEKQCDFCNEEATVRSINTNELMCDDCLECAEYQIDINTMVPVDNTEL